MNNKIICGDSLETLKTLEDESINCCITSPPYWGLRDYGTAKWDGGDPNCDHQYQKGGQNPKTSSVQLTSKGTTYSQYEHKCGKCGAIRIDNQLGLEKTPEEYVEKLVNIFKEVKRVLKNDGTCWLNLGDTYWGGGWRGYGLYGGDLQKSNKGSLCGNEVSIGKGKHDLYKPKDLVGIPWMVAFALRADGWWLRQDIIWSKKNCMPESVTDRCTKSHEYVFLLTKSKNYYYDHEAIKEDSVNSESYTGVRKRNRKKILKEQNNLNMDQSIYTKSNYEGKKYEKRNKRSVWWIGTRSFPEAHFAVFPPKLIEPCVLAGCPENGIILDPFMGSGTTAVVAKQYNRNYLGIELNEEYIEIAEREINKVKEPSQEDETLTKLFE